MKKIILGCFVILFSCNQQTQKETSAPAAAEVTAADTSSTPPVNLSLGGTDDGTYSTSQTFQNKDIASAYAEFLKGGDPEVPYLEKVLPEGDLKTRKEEADVNYRRISPAQMEITLSFPGGETIISFSDKNQNTTVVVSRSPD
jgi:hypothetical protein